MPRIQTVAVCWNSPRPTRLPIKSFGSRIPLFVLMKMYEWRKARAGNTGIAVSGLPMHFDVMYEDNEISEASKS